MKSDNSYAVATFGIPDFELELVERIFSLSESRDYIYRIVDESENHTAEIALVDMTSASGASQFEEFHAEREGLPTVIIANGSEPDAKYWVKRPFTAMRMLGALDSLVEKELIGVNGQRAKTPGQSKPAAEAAAPTAPTQTTPSPRVAKPKSEAKPAAAKPAAAAGIYKALVVDDSAPVRKQVNVALRRVGITAEFAEDAETALQLIESRSYDILFLDVVLPGKDGYEICKAVKRDKDKKHIPVVMLTGKSSPFDKVKGKLSGCDAYLTKPVSLKEFNQTLSKWLNPPLSFETMADEA